MANTSQASPNDKPPPKLEPVKKIDSGLTTVTPLRQRKLPASFWQEPSPKPKQDLHQQIPLLGMDTATTTPPLVNNNQRIPAAPHVPWNMPAWISVPSTEYFLFRTTSQQQVIPDLRCPCAICRRHRLALVASRRHQQNVHRCCHGSRMRCFCCCAQSNDDCGIRIRQDGVVQLSSAK